MGLYFPFADYWWFYVGFSFFVVVLLLVDLGIFHRHTEKVSFKDSLVWSIIWISMALIFNWLFYQYALDRFASNPRLLAIPGFDPAGAAKQVGLEFLTGFVVEKTLAIDNIFIFAVVFSYFAIPAHLQRKILFFGILGALIFRALFIGLGSFIMGIHWVGIFFGVLLILTGIKMFFAPEKPIEPEKNPVIRVIKKLIPVTPSMEGGKFFIRKNGVLFATPLFVALIFLELTDIVFAIDSVPAIFALTKEPLIVFTSNIFAILGLRSLYFLMAGSLERFHLIKYGLAMILIFVGAKMAYLNELFGGKFPISWSMGIIGAILGTTIILSLVVTPKPHKV
ncbi:MAG: TerC/Alx family metal homeostasis membrane protein [Oligoflexia bacterium]|nr:TerC/Alx family metal homeostasis membrane protein [Oligoflexia bacterium]